MDIKQLKLHEKGYPKQLSLIKNPPKKLYVAGNEKVLENIGIAVIGSRCSTNYGEEYATRFSKELAKNGISIISGMASRNRYMCT